jgi:peptide-methionine (S)-S-oxide reductase
MSSERGPEHREVVTLGGGCFWCLEAVFRDLDGVLEAEPGYSGGTVANPQYEQVCTGATGHAEVVQVVFDTGRASLREVLEVFFAIHDPTTLNRQGADVGTQYRSVIFFRSAEQESTAKAVIAELEQAGVWDDPIVTELAPFEVFYSAEDHHRLYFDRHPSQPYCRAVVAPKVAKFRRRFAHKLKTR